MKAFLAAGGDVNTMSPSFGGRLALSEAATLGLRKVVRFLVENGASIDAVDGHGLTALMHACSVGKAKGSEVVLYLLQSGADPNCVRATDEMTAIKFAARQATPEAIAALVKNGAEVDGPLGTKQTALMIAARADNVPSIKILLQSGANIDARCGLPWANGRTAEQLAELEGCSKAFKYLQSMRNAGGASEA